MYAEHHVGSLREHQHRVLEQSFLFLGEGAAATVAERGSLAAGKHIDVQYNGKEYHFDEHPPIKKDQKLCNVTVEKFYATAVVPEQKYDNGT
ncbi:hypothetical protein OSTOST_17275, partial [Ostertagia ostertagi]